MEGANRRLLEITQHIKGDQQANSLIDEVLSACFDYVLAPAEMELSEETERKLLENVLTTLARFNALLKAKGTFPDEGLFSGTPEETAAWAEDLTQQILENRPD